MLSPLEREGVTVMEYLPECQRYFDVHHCLCDTLENVHPRELELGAALIAAMIHGVADLDEALPRREKPAETSKPAGNTNPGPGEKK